MNVSVLETTLTDGLAVMLAAREHVMANPDVCPPPSIPDCATCGGSVEWPAWVSLTGRCVAPIHQGVTFSTALNLWVSRTGVPVCQDHAHPMPCPFPGKSHPTNH